MSPVDQLDKNIHDIPKDWDWQAKLPSWVWHNIAINNYKKWKTGWDVVDNNPPFVLLLLTRKDGDIESAEIAKELDDIAKGMFYYRDWTNSSLPYVSKDEKYMSGFWFQKLHDAISFNEKYDGVPSWDPEFEEKRIKMKESIAKS